MIIVLKQGTEERELELLKNMLNGKGVFIQDIASDDTRIIVLSGNTSAVSEDAVTVFPFTEKVIRIQQPYRLAGRKFHPQDSIIEVEGRRIGGGHFSVIAGPCSVENENQIVSAAEQVKMSGASFLRGGAFKPRTSPYSFSGLGLEGLGLLKLAREKTGLPIVTEIMSEEYLDIFAEDVDIIQIGARNMQNYALLRQTGSLHKPVLLKRGLASSADELIMSAEHLLAAGASDVILCERGIRTFETAVRSTLDLSAVPVLKSRTHLPVIVDPSHAAGHWEFVEPLALAAAACGCDGLMIEVHGHPEQALCDGAQSVTPQIFDRIMKKVNKIREII